MLSILSYDLNFYIHDGIRGWFVLGMLAAFGLFIIALLLSAVWYLTGKVDKAFGTTGYAPGVIVYMKHVPPSRPSRSERFEVIVQVSSSKQEYSCEVTQRRFARLRLGGRANLYYKRGGIFGIWYPTNVVRS